jgi:hypothetical protein
MKGELEVYCKEELTIFLVFVFKPRLSVPICSPAASCSRRPGRMHVCTFPRRVALQWQFSSKQARLCAFSVGEVFNAFGRQFVVIGLWTRGPLPRQPTMEKGWWPRW